jgi:hypothetical protein
MLASGFEHFLQRGYSFTARAGRQATERVPVVFAHQAATVGRALEASIVQRHELSVAAQPEIDFEPQRDTLRKPEPHGPANRLAGVFRGFTGAACLGNQQKGRHGRESRPNQRRCR